MNKIILFFVFMVLSIGMPDMAVADVYQEFYCVGGYSANNGWVQQKNPFFKNAVGLEYFKKFSNEYGDFLTCNVQVRLTYDSMAYQNDFVSVELHNAWLAYKLELGKEIRFGHFDVPFGSEPIMNTHSTFIQTLNPVSLGLKKDWGTLYKGFLGEFDYQVALSLGSGMSIYRKDNSFVFAMRLEDSGKNDFRYGVSFIMGNVLKSSETRTFPRAHLLSEQTVSKKLIGLDGQYQYGPFLIIGDMALGRTNQKLSKGGALGVNYTFPNWQRWDVKSQVVYWEEDWRSDYQEKSFSIFTLSYQLTNTISCRIGYFYDFKNYGNELDRTVLLQLYYFGR